MTGRSVFHNLFFWVLAIGVAGGCFFAAKSFATTQMAEANITIKPFVFRMNVYSYPDSGVETLSEIHYVGRRSDGARVERRSVGPLDKDDWTRNVRLPSGTSIELYDALLLKTTNELTDDRFKAAYKKRLTAQRDTCNFNARAVVIGTESILGQPLEDIVTFVDGGEYKLITSNAPSLGCEGLAYESLRRQGDGSYKLSMKGIAQSLEFQQPDPKLFEISPAYAEVKRGEMERQIGSRLHAIIAGPASGHASKMSSRILG